MSKELFCIRHGTSQHNNAYLFIGEQAFNKYEDSKLLPSGYTEAQQLGRDWKKINEIELVIVSPLSRTLETATQIFKGTNTQIIALDCLIEFPQHQHLCNKRISKETLKEKYPHVNFDRIANDLYWDSEKEESYETLKERVSFSKQWISMRNEYKIAIVSHSSYLSEFMNKKIDYNEQLKHCYPYELTLNYW